MMFLLLIFTHHLLSLAYPVDYLFVFYYSPIAALISRKYWEPADMIV